MEEGGLLFGPGGVTLEIKTRELFELLADLLGLICPSILINAEKFDNLGERSVAVPGCYVGTREGINGGSEGIVGTIFVF